MLLQLDQFIFKISDIAFQDFVQSTTYRWESQSPISAAPVQQFMGPGAGTVTLRGVSFPPYFGKPNQLEKLKTEATKGEPMLILDGQKNGTVQKRLILGNTSIKIPQE
jgi:uncharacterized protein